MININSNFITRPAATGAVPEGAYKGKLAAASTKEVDSKFTDTGKRNVLELKTELDIGNGEISVLYHQVTLTWSEKGKMLPLLKKLDVLPEPGKDLDLNKLVDLPVTVIVENIKKDDKTFSNIVSMKRNESITFVSEIDDGERQEETAGISEAELDALLEV